MTCLAKRRTTKTVGCSCVQPSELHIEDALAKLVSPNSQKSISKTIPAGGELFRSGDPCDAIYSLVDGWVALYDLFEDGRRQILKFGLPGALLAFSPRPDSVVNYSAQALTEVVIRTMPRDEFIDLCKDHAQLGLQLVWWLSQDRDLAYEHLASIGRQSAHARVAHLLLELFVRCRLRWPGYRIEEMHLPLTQEDVGDATGLTGVHVNRVLRQLRQDGILEFHYHKLRILDPDRLADAAGVDTDVARSWMQSDPHRDGPPVSHSGTVVPIWQSVEAIHPRSSQEREVQRSSGCGCRSIGRCA